LRSRYRFPDQMRPASLQERHEFYKREFRTNLILEWFRGWTKPIVFAVVIGRHTKIFPARYRGDRDRTILIDEYDTLQDLRRYCVEFKPESVYYDRNLYKNWDEARRGPGNFECPIHGTLEEKMNRRQGLSFCRLELQLAQEQALGLAEELSRSFRELRIVYSGRGFHVHVLDEDAFFWTAKRRLKLARSLSHRGYLMDEWVAGGGMRLIRLPHSLNGLVSRVARPLGRVKVSSFDAVTDPFCLPGFSRS